MSALEALRYPIGKFVIPETIDENQLESWIVILEELPAKFAEIVSDLTEAQLDTPYRPEGWTIRQVIHHVGDSHHNSYTRFKWALTEDNPLIKAYHEDRWADLFDTTSASIEPSLAYLKALHYKLTFLIRGLTRAQLERTFVHPETNEATSLLENVGRYAWHGSHHYAHIENVVKKNNWK